MAKKKTAKKAASRSTGTGTGGSATKPKKKPKKKAIESYDHKDKTRANNPPVGLVTPDTDPDHGKKKTYEYDPHLDPQLVWAGKMARRIWIWAVVTGAFLSPPGVAWAKANPGTGMTERNCS